MENIMTVVQARRAAGFARQGAYLRRWLGLDATESDRRAAECDALAERLEEAERAEREVAVLAERILAARPDVLALTATVLALTVTACGRPAPAPVVVPVAAPVVVAAPVPVVEEEPAAWRCVREGRCAVPRDVDGGILGAR